MCKMKSTARREHMVAASSSNSEDDLSLGADKKETCAESRCCLLPVRFHSVETVCLHSGVNSPANTRHICFDFGFGFFFTYNIICEQLINILFIFRFTNIEVVQVITSAFKSSMKILLFQWNQVSRYPNWRPYIDAWFRRFEVGVNF
jgi:hypothetical protein